MLVEESIWIAEKIKEILLEEPFPVLNIGSSTLVYRTKKQPFIQNNIFNLFQNNKQTVKKANNALFRNIAFGTETPETILIK